VKNCPGALIPPLPEKQILGRFDEKFISSRQRGLEDFLSRVLNHPILGKEIFVQSFVEDNDLNRTKSEEETARKEKGSVSWSVWFTSKASAITSTNDVISTSP
jgi:hypothetical protein